MCPERRRNENRAIVLVLSDLRFEMKEEGTKRIIDPFMTLKEVLKSTPPNISSCLGIAKKREGSMNVSRTHGNARYQKSQFLCHPRGHRSDETTKGFLCWR